QNGDLFVAEGTAVTKVATSEAVSTFASGFASLIGLDVWHEPGTSFGVLAVADSGPAQIKALPLDNPSITPVVLTSATTPRAVCFASGTFASTQMIASDQSLILTHNNAGRIQSRHEPYLIAEPYAAQ